MGLKPWEYSEISHKDYMLMCIGHRDKLRRQEYLDRSLQYLVMAQNADPKKLPKIHNWWPIEGEPIKKIRIPNAKRLAQIDAEFRKLGQRKNG